MAESKNNTIDFKYESLLSGVKNNFEVLLKTYDKVFTTDAQGLWDIYINHIPEHLRQIKNCNTCKKFIEKYGHLVFIKEDGSTVSAIWSFIPPEYCEVSIAKLKSAVEKAKVTGVFISNTSVLGVPVTGAWQHLSVEVPDTLMNHSRIKTAGQVRAEKKEDYEMLNRALESFGIETIETALTILESETLYRGDRVLGVAKWFKGVHEKRNLQMHHGKRENITWLQVAKAPAGFCHIKSSMIGTLLEDIAQGLPYEQVKMRFDEKMKPSNYMRSQSEPSINQIKEAEKMVEKLGVAPSLQRRYATLDEIPEFLWQPSDIKQEEKNNLVPTNGVFSHLIKQAKERRVDETLPAKLITWEKFENTVLPFANKIEAKVDDVNRLMAILTAQDPSAPNIFRWDNVFSWYYHGGVDAEIRRRVELAGGRYENNEIRCSLIWEGGTDLDLHCMTPQNGHIYYGNKNGYGGYLDVDANGGGITTMTPVENIRFLVAKEGIYRFEVHNYQDRNKGYNPFKVELEVNGHIVTFEGELSRTNEQITVFEFMFRKNQAPEFINNRSGNIAFSTEDWGIPANQFVTVTGITKSPNLWGAHPRKDIGTHIFFLLDQCKDTTTGKGRGFFNEFLKGELKQYRKVLEAFTASMSIHGVENATACGVGYSKDQEWHLTLKVQLHNQIKYFKIDRWD